MQDREFLAVRIGEEKLGRVAKTASQVARELKQPGPLTRLRFEKYTIELSLFFLEAYGGNVPEVHQESHIVETAISWYENNLDRGIGVREVASEMGYSDSHLRRLFVATLNTSPREVFLRIRMDKARSLLRYNRITVLEAALACGYPDHSSFSRAFKRFNGYPPVRMLQRTD